MKLLIDAFYFEAVKCVTSWASRFRVLDNEKWINERLWTDSSGDVDDVSVAGPSVHPAVTPRLLSLLSPQFHRSPAQMPG